MAFKNVAFLFFWNVFTSQFSCGNFTHYIHTLVCVGLGLEDARDVFVLRTNNCMSLVVLSLSHCLASLASLISQ